MCRCTGPASLRVWTALWLGWCALEHSQSPPSASCGCATASTATVCERVSMHPPRHPGTRGLHDVETYLKLACVVTTSRKTQLGGRQCPYITQRNDSRHASGPLSRNPALLVRVQVSTNTV
jgi:hypothetical protein